MKKHWYKFITTAFFVHLAQGTFGQSDHSNFYQKDKVGITVSSFLNNYSGVQFNFAKGISEGMDFNTELGYIFDAGNRDECKGFRIRIQPRFRMMSDPSDFGAYISPLLQYRYTNSMIENIFSRFDGAYFQQITHKEVNNMISVGGMVGRFYKMSNHIYINVAFGFGINYANISFPGVPDDAIWQEEFEDVFFLSQSTYDYKDKGDYFSLLLISHINFFYKFN